MTIPGLPIRVVKLGGSLLDLERLPDRLARWIAAQAAIANVIVVGGGALADAIRAAYKRHGLDEEAAHWLCVRLLSVTAELVHRLMPQSRLASRFDELHNPSEPGSLVLFQTEQFLREVEPGLTPPHLPHSWDATSDSIAARLAVALGAGELVLLKSSLPQPGTTIERAAAEGYVDRWFPRAACGLAVRAVNLRDDSFAERVLT